MTHLLDENSALATKSELDIFSVPPTQVAVESNVWTAIHPTNAIAEDTEGPFTFIIPRDPEYLDLNTTWLIMRLSIRKGDGTAIAIQGEGNAARYEAAPINNIGSTLWKTVKIFFNSRLVYDSGAAYAYRCHIEDTLNYPPSIKEGILQAAGYYHDDPGQLNLATNAGYIERGKMANASRIFEIMAPLHADCFSHDRLLLNNMEIRLELYRNNNRFAIDALGMALPRVGYQGSLKVHSLRWLVRKVTLAPSVNLALEHRLSTQAARYPIRRVDTRSYHLPDGITSVHQLQIGQGQLPRRVVLGMVRSEAFDGSYQASALEFSAFQLKTIQLYVAGVAIPRVPLECDFEAKHYAQAYVGMFDNLNTGLDDRGNGISYKDFGGGYALFVFNLTSDNSEVWHLVREGTVTVNIRFGTPIATGGGIKLLVYSEMENLMLINKFRETYFDFSH